MFFLTLHPWQLTAIFLATIVILIYLYLKSCYRYWEIRNIPYLKPNLFFGNASDLVLGRKSILEFQKHMYSQMKPNKLMGTFMFQKPTLQIGDIYWIKCILTKDAHNFFDRGLKFDTKTEPLTKHLFHLESEEWKIVKNKVLPAFTLDGILVWFPLLLDSAINLKHYIGEVSKTQEDLDLKEIMSRYAAEVIGKCVFGLEKGPLTGDNEKFYKMSKKIFSPRMRTIIKLILPRLPNFITKLFDIKMIETEVSDYFSGIIKNQLKYRRQYKRRPNDFLSFMMDLQDKDKDHCTDIMPMTDELIMAQCFMFFIAAYENTTGVLCAALFELGRHPEIQEKLFTEIREVCYANNEFEVNFKRLPEMTYLHKVACELLRLYPPATALIRECNKDYILPGSDIKIEKGLQIVIPVTAINVDPTYYTNPDVFDPEHFSEEAVKSRNRYAFIPFGEGPRACIGQKFGMIQMKVGLISLILNYKFFPSPKMKVPVVYEKKVFINSFEGGAWVRCETRNLN